MEFTLGPLKLLRPKRKRGVILRLVAVLGSARVLLTTGSSRDRLIKAARGKSKAFPESQPN